MVENIQGNSGANRAAPASSKSTAKSTDGAAGGAAFHALLERLETQARELEAQSRSIESPKELSGAVDRAHASLQDVLSLSDRLVEAYREVLARNQPAEKPGNGPQPGAKP
jgi:flagellar hook-basal body complex protein FliE